MGRKIIGILLAALLLLPSAAFAQGTPPYKITVNLTQNIVTVYGKDGNGGYTRPERAFTCSAGGYTPTGTFRTTDKYTWRPLVGNVYGQYATRITGSILFHSVPYFKQDKSTLEYMEYNKLGTTASAGCIRLSVADAKWIYDNCPSGTTVEMYRGNRAEPLQPQAPIRIDTADSRRGWDPTDPDPRNPWGTAWAGEPAAEEETELPDDDPPAWLEGLLETETAAPVEPEEVPGPMTEALANSRQWKQEEAALDALSVRTARVRAAWTAKGRYTGADCYLSAQDAKRVFAHLGVTLLLPQQAGGDTANVRCQRDLYQATVREIGGQAYYSLRELAEIAGASVEARSDSFSLYQYGEEVRIGRV